MIETTQNNLGLSVQQVTEAKKKKLVITSVMYGEEGVTESGLLEIYLPGNGVRD